MKRAAGVKDRVFILNKQDIFKGSLVLVNREYPLHEKIFMSGVSLVPVNDSCNILLDKAAANMLKQLMAACLTANGIAAVSGYRSLQEQQKIFKDSLEENGEEFTEKFVALPGHSEHQTGLAIDVAENIGDIDFICPSFPYEGVCQTFREKAPQYGFIERYQKGKREITGISHEPWHFRYVGYPHSVIISKNNFALEEYIAFVRNYNYEGRHLLFEDARQSIEIFYMKAPDEASGGTAEFMARDGRPYQVSGNNADGFIFTEWRRRQ